ncbi:MAG TPA: DUF542 domain-containing protein [Fastidiosipila sp.]|nr:DUF542 domain-containing protein [Eubacteriales bacterium]HHU04425.1 DUF542 domain-containing protein [Fastidiosipila sp.]
MIKLNMTIAEAVKTNPDIIDLLSEYGIDYCCQGSRKLLGAIEDKKLVADEFVRELNNVPTSSGNVAFKDALKLDKPENKKMLIAYIIKQHHRLEEKLLSELDEYLPILLRVHYDEHSEELSELYKKFSQLNAELTVHMTKEERSEFPKILSAENYDSTELRAEHEIIEGLIHEIKFMTNAFSPPPDCCQTYELSFARLKELYDDIHQHFFLENHILFT